jgi:hypothetical protein
MEKFSRKAGTSLTMHITRAIHPADLTSLETRARLPRFRIAGFFGPIESEPPAPRERARPTAAAKRK